MPGVKKRSQPCAWRVVPTLFTCGLVLVPACSEIHKGHQAQAEQHWKEVRAKVKFQLARQQYESGLVEDAASSVSEALALDPFCADYHVLLARCRLEQGQVMSAERTIELAAGLDADSSELAYVRGIIAERRGQFEQALEFYNQARTANDTEPDYLVSEAECLVALRRPQQAAELIDATLTDYGDDPTIHALAGEIALLLGNERKACECFAAVLSSGRYDAVIAEQYALLAVRLGRYADALDVLEPLVEQPDGDVPASVVRAAARCMLALDRPEAAKMRLNKLIDRDPTDVQSWVLLARAGIETNDAAVIRRSAANVRRLAPSASQSLLIDAYACLVDDDLAGAFRALEELLAADENDVLAHCLTGHVAERAGATRTARKHYRRALQIEPRCEWARQALRNLNAETGRAVSLARPTGPSIETL